MKLRQDVNLAVILPINQIQALQTAYHVLVILSHLLSMLPKSNNASVCVNNKLSSTYHSFTRSILCDLRKFWFAVCNLNKSASVIKNNCLNTIFVAYKEFCVNFHLWKRYVNFDWHYMWALSVWQVYIRCCLCLCHGWWAFLLSH